MRDPAVRALIAIFAPLILGIVVGHWHKLRAADCTDCMSKGSGAMLLNQTPWAEPVCAHPLADQIVDRANFHATLRGVRW